MTSLDEKPSEGLGNIATAEPLNSSRESRLVALYKRVYGRDGLPRALKYINLFAVLVNSLSFLAILAILVFARNDYQRALSFLAVCAIPFVCVSLLRGIINAPRPYELFDFEGLGLPAPKKKKGKSFPSRHVFSAFVIGSATCFMHLWLGIFLLILGVACGACRVLLGSHFLRDVITGAVIGGVCGTLGMLIFTLCI